MNKPERDGAVPPGKPSRSFMGKALGRVTRYTVILGVLVRYGFSDLVRRTDIDAYRRLRRSGRRSRIARRQWTRPERMRRAIEELGPTFIKIGQILSHRPDILPEDWIREFEKLRSAVPAVPARDVLDVMKEEFRRSTDELFSEFESEPIASASIAQVHRARLIGADGGPGDLVAVKIQRPGVARTIHADLAILRDFARIVERRVPALAPFHPVDVVSELSRALSSELDFRNEADNLETFRKNFTDDTNVSAPRPYRELSGRRILTMEYIDGMAVSDLGALEQSGIDRSNLARQGAEAVLRQIFEHRFFHSDPHGNNILIRKDGTIVFLDFGQIGSILPSQRRFLADLMAAIVRSDAVRAVRAILSWSGYQNPEVVRRLTLDMEHVIEDYLTRPFNRLDLGEMTGAMLHVIRRYEIDIPANFYLLAKAMATIENIATGLDGDFDFVRASRPFVKKMIRREMEPERLTEQMTGMAGDTVRFLRDLPGDALDLIHLLKSGKMQMEFELRDMDKMNETIKRVVTRLSAAVLLAAMIMGSSILVQSRIPPLVAEIPVIGIAGFMISGFIGIYLLYDLWKHRG